MPRPLTAADRVPQEGDVLGHSLYGIPFTVSATDVERRASTLITMHRDHGTSTKLIVHDEQMSYIRRKDGGPVEVQE